MTALIEKWQKEREKKAFLALEDGTIFHGVAFGYLKDTVGEVVFNTGMAGYQEILTDPSYAGQFVTLTYPEIGNYGVNEEDVESRSLFLNGLVIHDLTEPSNYRSTMSLDEYLKKAKKPGIYGVDTRALTIHLRDHGNMKAYLHVEPSSPEGFAVPRGSETLEEWAVNEAKNWEGLDGQDYAAKVTTEEAYDLGVGFRCRCTEDDSLPLVVAYDFGVKTNILRNLSEFALVRVVPAKTSAAEVLAMNPKGVFLSNGPADPAAVTYAVENIKAILGKVPIMGICLGHQLLSIASGAKTGRLKFGHHGCNHPVKNLKTGAVEITSQNHNFAVLPESIPECLEVTHINLNDGSIEGVRHKEFAAFSVQYHPESCPGPHDSKYLFEEFKELIKNNSIVDLDL